MSGTIRSRSGSGVQLSRINVPQYTIGYWSNASSEDIQRGVKAGQITTYTAGSAPYTYTAYKIVDTSRYRLVKQANYDYAPVIEYYRFETRNEGRTIIVKNGSETKVVYAKRTFIIRKRMEKEGAWWDYRCYISIQVDEAIPQAVSFECYWRHNSINSGSKTATLTLAANKTYVEDYAVFKGGFWAPPAWSGFVTVLQGIYARQQISNDSGAHAKEHSVTLY